MILIVWFQWLYSNPLKVLASKWQYCQRVSQYLCCPNFISNDAGRGVVHIQSKFSGCGPHPRRCGWDSEPLQSSDGYSNNYSFAAGCCKSFDIKAEPCIPCSWDWSACGNRWEGGVGCLQGLLDLFFSPKRFPKTWSSSLRFVMLNYQVRDWVSIAPDHATFNNAYKIRKLKEGEIETKPVPHSFIFTSRSSSSCFASRNFWWFNNHNISFWNYPGKSYISYYHSAIILKSLRFTERYQCLWTSPSCMEVPTRVWTRCKRPFLLSEKWDVIDGLMSRAFTGVARCFAWAISAVHSQCQRDIAGVAAQLWTGEKRRHPIFAYCYGKGLSQHASCYQLV